MSERIQIEKQTFAEVFLPLVELEIDRIIEQIKDLSYNDGNTVTSHSEGMNKL